jgi:hypothetical protein
MRPLDTVSNLPSLAFIGARQFRQSGQQRKGRSGHKPEHTEALAENASRMFATEVEKALNDGTREETWQRK